MSKIDEYWAEHTVPTEYFASKEKAQEFSKWRLDLYPFYWEFMKLYELHENEIIVDYGCGPGNDLVHFIKTKAKKIIGIDISNKALIFAKHQLSLYNIPIPVELIKINDDTITIPLKDNSVDYIICSGVLHHASQPLSILKEFFRILKPNSLIRIMVYNRNSIFFHLYIAYLKRGGFPNNDADIMFSKSTDGEHCPKSIAYIPKDFVEICNNIEFQTKYIGGYFSSKDSIDYLNNYKQAAINDNNLRQEHRDFLNSIKIDKDGCPTYEEKYCGIGGVYELYKK